MKKMIRYGGSVRTRTVPRGSPIGYPGKSGVPPLPPPDRFLFNGVDQYMTFTAWTPTSINYTISAYTHWKAQAAGATNMIVGQEALTTAIYVSTDTGSYTARNLLDPTGNMFLASTVQAAPVIVQHILEVIGSQSEYSVTGGLPDVDTRQTLPLAEITQVGGRSASARFNGYIAEVQLIDHADPSNSRWYQMDEGTGATILCYEENGDPKPDNTLDGTIQNYTDNWGPIP